MNLNLPSPEVFAVISSDESLHLKYFLVKAKWIQDKILALII